MKIMKRIFIIMAMVILSAAVWGQNCFKDGTEWKTYIYDDTNPYGGYMEISKLEGTENIDGYESLKMYSMHEDKPDSKTLTYYIRTDIDKVYFMPAENDSRTWYLMYDFNMVPGQGCYVYCPIFGEKPSRYYIKCVGISKKEDTKYSTMEMEDYADETCNELTKGEGEWLKGISSIAGVDYNAGFGMAGYGSMLLEVKNGNEIFYSQTPSSVSQISQFQMGIRIDGLNLILSNIKKGNKLNIYYMDGKLLGSYKLNEKDTMVRLPQRGAYVLKIGNDVKKIFVQSSDK